MLKNISQLECKINDKLYHLTCDNDSPLEHVKESLFQFQKYVGHIEDQIKAQQAQAQSEQSAEIKEEIKE
jgi:hypothetical protein